MSESSKDLTSILEFAKENSLASPPAENTGGSDDVQGLASENFPPASEFPTEPQEQIHEFDALTPMPASSESHAALPDLALDEVGSSPDSPADQNAPSESFQNQDFAPLDLSSDAPAPAFSNLDMPSTSEMVSPAMALEAVPTESKVEELKDFGEKIAIGTPKLEGTPPFSLLLKFSVTEQIKDKLLATLEAADLGLRAQDVELQINSGTLLIPHVSEFAAIQIGQQVREFVDDIEFGLASEVYSKDELQDDFESVLFDAELFHQENEVVHDVGAEPHRFEDMFSTHLTEVPGYQVTRVLSTVSVTRAVAMEIMEAMDRAKLETTHREMTQELLRQAFSIGAHGILGIGFTSQKAEVAGLSGPKMIYRLWATATAVRVSPISNA